MAEGERPYERKWQRRGFGEIGGGVRGADRARSAHAGIAGGCILAIRALPFRAAFAREDLNAIVASAVELFHGRLEGIALKTDLAATLPPVKADRELLRRVVANLIDNAAESMEGSTIRRLRVATRVDAEGETVEIEVADSGHGISPEDKEKLFLPHFSTKDRGTGLGLAIASRIIAEHNGTIRVEDNLPTGSKVHAFASRWPKCCSGSTIGHRSASNSARREQGIGSVMANVLIVDDEERDPRIARRDSAGRGIRGTVRATAKNASNGSTREF